MRTAQQFFSELCPDNVERLDHTVDALSVGIALGIPNAIILSFVAELAGLEWIEIEPHPPYARLPVRVTARGRESQMLAEVGTP